MDLTTLPAPAFTTIDGLTQGLAAACYGAIGLAAWVRAPRDIRTRVFLAFALVNILVFGVPTLVWLRGWGDAAKLPASATAAVMAGLAAGALLLFHFTQVFPRRRPWIRTSGIQMPVAYALTPPAVTALTLFAPASVADLRPAYILMVIVFGFPLIVLLAFVLPVAAIVSLSRSHREFHATGAVGLTRVIALILLSQVAGGVLAVVFAPILTVVAPNSPSRFVLTLAIWSLGLLTPLAFAAAVWKHDVLALSAD